MRTDRPRTWPRNLRAALARDTPALTPNEPTPSCTVDTSCEEGHHSYSWPCDYALGTGRLEGQDENARA